MVVLFAALCAFQGALAQEAAKPTLSLTGRVVDAAGIIDPAQRQQLVQKLADFEAKSSDQLVVVTVPSLNGEDIETYSNRLFRAWALGQKQENNGILLVVAPNDRKVRIEVGYGLEGVMTDALSSIIINGTIIPEFRSGNYSQGIVQGWMASSRCFPAIRSNLKRGRSAMCRPAQMTWTGSSWSSSPSGA